jgi:hypothetical protein
MLMYSRSRIREVFTSDLRVIDLINVKVKEVFPSRHEGKWQSGGIAPLILSFRPR